MDKPAKSWCYTLNNYSEDDKYRLSQLECSFHICAGEVGESGTPHLQGMITFRKAARLSALKKIHPSAHWEITKAEEAAANYCTKENILWKLDNRRPRGSNRSFIGSYHVERVWCTGCCFRIFECIC